MRILLLLPGKQLPEIKHIDDNIAVLRAQVSTSPNSDYITAKPVDVGGYRLLMVTDMSGLGAPNRVIDGKLIRGPIAFCTLEGARPAGIPEQIINWLRFGCDWPAVEKGA